MHHRPGVFLFALLLASFGFVGCSGLVAGNSGNPPPPSTLVITNVKSGSVTTSSSQVAWTTNVPADSSVDFGTTTAYGTSTPVNSGMVTSHQMTLSSLAAGTTYYYQVNSTDSKGNHGHGGNKFNTTGFSLSGTINPATGGSGSTLTLSGAAGSTATTADSVGNYTFPGLPNGTYTIAPNHVGFTFTPSSQNMTVNGVNVTGVNFTDTAQTFSISGTISPTAGGSGATVTLGGAASVATTANSSGAYTVTGLASGSYTITPSNTGYTFTPANQNATVSTGNVAGVNFTANAAPVAPTITTQPASQTVVAGQTASFNVAVTGTALLNYQWNKNGAAISGATSSSYTTPATTSSDNGAQFTVQVSNTAGGVTSNAATLTVNAAPVAPSFTTQPASQTVTVGQTASFSVAATGTAPLNYQWSKNGAPIPAATSSSYTTPATTSSDNGAQFTVVVSNTAGSVTSSAATLTVNAAPVAPSITTQPASQTVTAGQTASFSVAASGTTPLSYQWNRNGTAISGATSSSYTTPATTSSDNGALFTALVSNTAGSVTSTAATLTVNAAPVVPSITTQPASQTVTAGQTASFSVAATGTTPLSYQWNRNGTAISGATSSSYTTPATTSSDNGALFTALVSNTAGSVTSSAATLTVSAAPVAPSITAQPTSQTVTAGQTASFSVAATGTAPLSYQWNKNGTAISGATSSSYTTPATSSSDNGALFTVLVSNTAGSVTSNAATLTVNAAPVVPSITAQPASQTVMVGQTASFSVAATGTAPLSYLWNKNGTAISGATSSSYTTPATTIADSGASFAVVVSNTAGTVTSAAATLTVNPAPVAPTITTQPTNQAVTAGQTATFTVVAAGTAPLSYQWQKNAVNIAGATSASYTTPATTTADSGASFAVVVSNTAGTVTSAAATLTVNPAPAPAIQVSPTSINFGNAVVGTNLSQALIIKNTGTATLTISQVTATGSGFSVSGFSAPFNVSAGQQTTITVAFLPTVVGSTSGNISIVSNTPTSPTSVGLSGAGIAATYALGVTPTSLGFGTVNVSGNSSLSATLTNNGNSNVTISSVTVTGTGFSANGVSAGTTLTPNQSITLNVVFAPTAAGSLIGSVTAVSNATNSPAIIALSGIGAAATTINVLNYGATGNGTTNDTTAINNAIGALTSGATLLFPCGTYLVTSQLTVTTPNVTVDGGGCATIRLSGSGGSIMVIGNGAFSASFGSAVALASTANELATSFSTASGLGVAAGDYVYIHQGGKDYSTDTAPGHDTNCDVAGCRGELLKVASVSGNTITITTALHDTYNPSVNAAVVQKLLNPITGMTVKNIALDGSGTNNYGLLMLGTMDSTVSGVTVKNVAYTAMRGQGDFNLAWNNTTITAAGSINGPAFVFEAQGNPSVDTLSLSNMNPGPGPNAFGLWIAETAGGTFANITVDATGAHGRPFKTVAARWNTWNSLTVKNLATDYNGIALEYYSSHNTFNGCVLSNNGSSGTGTGNAGVNSFGNFNQYNTFNNCTMSGNGNVQLMIGSWDALGLGADSNVTINGGTYTGSNTVEPAILINDDNAYVKSANINGPGQGLSLGKTNACVNNNTFGAGTGLSAGILSNSSTNIGSGNLMNGYSSNLTPGTCSPSGVAISISPTVATVASTGTQQFTASVTGSTNTAVTWSATAGSISSSGLFTAPTVSTNTAVIVNVISQAVPSQTASATVTVTPPAPPNTFGYAVQGATIGTTMSNSVSATRYQMAGQNGTLTSMSVFIASPVSASPNNQFQVAIYADNNGTPGALIASSPSQTIVPDAWNTVPISAPVSANAYYWLAYNTNGLTANTNNLRYDAGGATSMWITSESFGIWPATYVPIGGTSGYRASIYATFQ